MHSLKPAITLAASTFLLSGCMYFGGSVEDCPEVDAPVSRVVPVDRSSLIIAILPVIDELTKTTDNSAAIVMQEKLSALAASRGMGLVNESEFEEIQNTIQLIDTGGSVRPSSVTNMEVLKTQVTGANLTYQFTPGDTMTPNSEATKSSICRYTARIDIEASLYTGAPLQKSLVLPFNGVHQYSVVSDDPECTASDELYKDLYSKAAEEAVNAIAALRTKRGLFEKQSYVRELRICFNKKYANYVWLSSGPDGTQEPGTKIKLYRQYWFKDKLKNEVAIRRSFVAAGKITKSENPDEIWVKISDMNEARKVMLGDIATLD
ncbi:MAG: hypothetical protein ACR2QG_03265 [Gammaproteobacteria bacterium]